MPAKSVSFSPDGTELVVGRLGNSARIWGLSNADIYMNRRLSAERRKRLGATVKEWFTGDLAGLKAKLAAAKTTLPPDDWQEDSNMVLERAAKAFAATAAGGEAPFDTASE